MNPQIINIINTLLWGLLICNFGYLIMKWYENKIDYHGYNEINEFHNENERLLKRASDELWFCHTINNIYYIFSENSVAKIETSKILNKHTNHLGQLLSIIETRQKYYEEYYKFAFSH